MAKQATELRYAVRFRVVFKYFGQLCLLLAGLTLVPLVVSVIFGDTPISLRHAIVIGGLAAFGTGLARLRAPSRVQANEGMVLVALMFLFTPLVMSYLRRMEWVTLIISVIALGLSVWAMKRTGGLNEMKKQIESVSSLGESLRKKTADVLDRVEKKVSPHYARATCCDRGYGRPSRRAVGSASRKPGVLWCSFDRLRTSSPCDVLTSTPQVRAPVVARWHDHLHDLATASRA